MKNYWPARPCATFKRVINKPKTDPPTIFFLEFIPQWTSFFHFRKKITTFFSIVQGTAREKTQKLLSIRGFTLLIRENNYETALTYRPFHKTLLRSSAFCKWISVRFYETGCIWIRGAVSITSPLMAITDPLKEIKMVKKVPSQIFFLLVPLGTIAQLFTKTKFHTSQSL